MHRDLSTAPEQRPMSIERALTAIAQGRCSLDKARHDLVDAIRILTHLGTEGERTEATVVDVERLARLYGALDQVESSRKLLSGVATSAPPRVNGAVSTTGQPRS